MILLLSGCASVNEKITDAGAVPYDVADSVFAKQWHIDNPWRHSKCLPRLQHDSAAKVRYASTHPDEADFTANDSLYQSLSTEHYDVYSRASGPVYAYDRQRDAWFVVWIEMSKPSTKTVEGLDDDNIKIEFDDGAVIDYHLPTKTYTTKGARASR